MDNQQNSIPTFAMEDLLSPNEDGNQINIDDSERLKLKKKLKRSLSRIASLEKQNLEITESKTRVDTRNTAARSLLQCYLNNSTLNDETRERFECLLRVLEPPRNFTANYVTLPPQTAVAELNVLADVQGSIRSHAQANTSGSAIAGNKDRKRQSSNKDNPLNTKQPRDTENSNIIRRQKSAPIESAKNCSLKIQEDNDINDPDIPVCLYGDGNSDQSTTPANKQSNNSSPNKRLTVASHSEPTTSNEENLEAPKTGVQSQQQIIPETTQNFPQMEMGDEDIVTSVLKQSAIEFFTKSLSQTTYSESCNKLIENLCGQLKYDHLALKLAAAYLNDTLQTNPDLEVIIDRYLAELGNENRVDPVSEEDENAIIVMKLFYMTCDKMEENGDAKEKAVMILYYTSFFSENISCQFLGKLYNSICIRNGVKMSLDDTFLFFKRFSIADFSSEDVFSIHPRLQQYIRNHQAWSFKVSMLSILDSVKNLLQNDEIPADQMIHAQTIWKHIQTDETLVSKYKRLPGSICSKLGGFGMYKESYDFSCEALTMMESTGLKNKKCAMKLKFWKGSALEELGRYSESLQLLTEVYEEQKELLGENADGALKTANYIGLAHCRLNNFEEAMKWNLATMEKREKLSGKEHAETLGLKNNMALALVSQEKYAEAAKIYSEVLQVYEKVPESNDRAILTTKHNLAIVRFHEKKFEDALEMLQEVLKVEETTLGVNHPDTLRTKIGIVEIYQALGRIKEAFLLANEVWQKRKEILGPQHPCTVESKHLVDGLNLKINL